MVIVELPVIVDPVPQNPLAGKAVAANPLNVAFKSLVKVIPVAALFRSRLLMVNDKSTVVPGIEDAGNEAYKNGLLTVNNDEAFPLGLEPF